MKTRKLMTTTLSAIQYSALVVAALACFAGTAQGASQYATGTFTWDNASTAAWGSLSGGPYTSTWTSGNDAVLEGTAGTITLSTPTAHNITFNTTGYTLSGASTLTLDGTAPTLTLGSGISGTISSVIAGSVGLTKAGTGTLTLTGANAYTGTTTINKGTLVLSGTDGSIGDPLTIYSGGTLTLDNTANYKSNRLGNGKAFTSNGGTFNYNDNTSSGSYAESIGALTLNAGALTLNTTQAASGETSTLTLSSITRNAGGTVLFSGTGLGLDDRNKVQVTTAPTFVNNILPYALMYDGANYNLINSFANGGPITPLTSYTDAQTLWTANTINARPTTDANGLVAGDRTVQNLIVDSGRTIKNSSTTDRTINIGNGGYGMIVQADGSGIITANVGGDLIIAFGANEAIFNTIGNLTFFRGNSPSFTGSGGMTKTGLGTLTLTGTQATPQFVSAMTGALNLNQGTVDIYSNGPGALNTLSSGINFNGGNLTIRDTKACAYNNPINVNADGTFTMDRSGTAGAPFSGDTFTTLTVNNSPNFTITAGDNYNSGTLNMILSGTMTLNSPLTVTLNNNAAPATMQLSVAAITDNGNTITLKGNGKLIQTGVWGAGAGGLMLDSSYTGTATLNQNNTFTGAAIVNGGTLSLARSGGSLADTVAVTVGGGILDVAQADTVGAVTLSSGTISGAGTLTGSSYALINTGTISAILGGSGITLTKTGSGTATLSGNNSYSGATTLSAGTLSVGATLNLGSSNPLIFDGGTLQVTGMALTTFGAHTPTFTATKTVALDINNAANTFTISEVLNQTSGGLTKTGAGALILSNANTYSGATTISNGTLHAGVFNAIPGNSAVAVAGGIYDLGGFVNVTNGAITMSSGAITNGTLAGSSYTLSGGTVYANLAGTNTLTKLGDGTVTLKGVNTYSGETTVSAGILALTTDTSLGATPALRIASGATVDLGAGITATAGTLYLNGRLQAKGTWGELGKIGVDHTSAYLTGAGVLNVQAGAGTLVSFL